MVITGECSAFWKFQVPVVWTTDTGTKWTISQFTGHQFGPGFDGVIAAGESGFLMVGGRTDLSVWDSPDATEWTHTSIGRAMWIGDASAHGSTVLVVGRTNYEGTPNNARVWIGTAIPK